MSVKGTVSRACEQNQLYWTDSVVDSSAVKRSDQCNTAAVLSFPTLPLLANSYMMSNSKLDEMEDFNKIKQKLCQNSNQDS